MQSRTIVFYITGHGFGHARRSGEIIRELLLRRADLHVHMKTTAPAELFSDLPLGRVTLHRSDLDPGAIEKDALTIDWERTASAVEEALRSKQHLSQVEAEFCKASGAQLIISYIPFLAGDIAQSAGVACIACGNFTWDWIYEPIFSAHPEWHRMLEEIRASYRKMETILKQPFGGDVSSFRNVVDVPLVVRRPRITREEVLRKLRIELTNYQAIILVAIRGGTSISAIARAGREGSEFLFLCPQLLTAEVPANVKQIEFGPELNFADVLAASDIVISKLGY